MLTSPIMDIDICFLYSQPKICLLENWLLLHNVISILYLIIYCILKSALSCIKIGHLVSFLQLYMWHIYRMFEDWKPDQKNDMAKRWQIYGVTFWKSCILYVSKCLLQTQCRSAMWRAAQEFSMKKEYRGKALYQLDVAQGNGRESRRAAMA